MANKWIIQGDDLRVGQVDFHRELAGKEGEIKSGGYWHFDKDNDILFLYGKSVDFGKCSIEDIQNAKLNGYAGRIQDITWKVSFDENLYECINNPEFEF